MVALIAASLAFGRIAAFLPVIEELLSRLGPSPARALATLEGDASRAPVRGLRYRWVTAADLAAFLVAVGGAAREPGGLEAGFARGIREGEDAASALVPFLSGLRARAAGSGPSTSGLSFLLPSGAGGSALKRPLLFLRWMVRRGPEGVDLGTWTCLPPSRLVIPLDTHVFRISRALGLTARATPGLAAAREITASLARLDPVDPVRYDFALCHMGISGLCRGRRDERLCAPCVLRPICRLP